MLCAPAPKTRALRTLALPVALAAMLVSLAGCLGKEDKDPPADNDAVTDGGGTDASSGSDSSAGSDSGGSADVAAAPTKFEPKCTADKGCKATEICISGVCVPKPAKDVKSQLTDPNNDNQPTTEKMDLSCVGKDLAEVIKDLPKGGKATMWGRVDRFGGGPVTTDVEVAVFLAADFHPEKCAGVEDPDEAQACFASDKIGKPIATVKSVDPDTAGTQGWLVERPKKAEAECDKGKHFQCPHGYVCDKIDGFPKCGKGHGVYAIEDVPLNTRLVIRTRASKANDPAGWHDTYTYNVVLFSTHLDDKGKDKQPSKYVDKDTVLYNPTIVGEGQWQLVPSTIGIVGGIYEGDGVIGGRIRDCGTKDRRSWPILDAKIGIGVPPEGISYFNDSELDPVPNKNRVTTNIIGRYAAVGITPGPNRVAVLGQVDGKTVELGIQDVYVIPNALVIASMPGFIPHWNK